MNHATERNRGPPPNEARQAKRKGLTRASLDLEGMAQRSHSKRAPLAVLVLQRRWIQRAALETHSTTSKCMWMNESLFGNTQLLSTPLARRSVSTVEDYVSACRFVTVSVPITVQTSSPGVSSAVGKRSTSDTATARPNANGARKRKMRSRSLGGSASPAGSRAYCRRTQATGPTCSGARQTPRG